MLGNLWEPRDGDAVGSRECLYQASTSLCPARALLCRSHFPAGCLAGKIDTVPNNERPEHGRSGHV